MTIKKYEPKAIENKEDTNKWTLFWDMHSGGGVKVECYDKIYIEAPYDKASRMFEEMFDRDPHHVTCDCCGQDYSVDSYPSFAEASDYHRKNRWGNKGQLPEQSVQDYVKEPTVLVVRTTDEELS